MKIRYCIFIISLLLFSCKNQEDYPWIVNINVKNIAKTNPYQIQNGYFSVSNTTQVQFAEGNLQYKDTTYRFAPSQLHCCHIQGLNNDGFEDFFAYSSSGFCCNIDGKNWRTPTITEWDHLLYHRKNAMHLMGQARIEGLNGLILLPDVWRGVDGISFVSSPKEASENIYTIDEWHRMEAAGAIFLPAAGYWQNNQVSFVGHYGYYWSSSSYYVFFAERGISVYPIDGDYNTVPFPIRISVRLVR